MNIDDFDTSINVGKLSLKQIFHTANKEGEELLYNFATGETYHCYVDTYNGLMELARRNENFKDDNFIRVIINHIPTNHVFATYDIPDSDTLKALFGWIIEEFEQKKG